MWPLALAGGWQAAPGLSFHGSSFFACVCLLPAATLSCWAFCVTHQSLAVHPAVALECMPSCAPQSPPPPVHVCRYALAPEAVQSLVRDSLARVGLDGFAERPAASLSGGQKQRVAIAGALAECPRVSWAGLHQARCAAAAPCTGCVLVPGLAAPVVAGGACQLLHGISGISAWCFTNRPVPACRCCCWTS